MNIVFIRHAKSKNYEANKRQSPDTELGEVGRKQSRFLAKKIKKMSKFENHKYDMIITSDWVRARQTADIISKELKIPVKEHPMIHEYLSNNILANKSLDSKIVREFKKAVEEKGINFDWKFRGEGECMRDVIERAKKFKNELMEKHKGSNYLIVSHGLFITSFVTLLITGDDYDDKVFDAVSKMIYLENTSITHLEYMEDKNRWRIHCLNDSSHLSLL